MTIIDVSYQGLVEDAVRASLKGSTTPGDLFSLAGGAFPTDVLAALTRLSPQREVEAISCLAEAPGTNGSVEDLSLFEWHFDIATVHAVIELLSLETSSVACLGAPTIAQELLHRGAGAVELFDLAVLQEAHSGRYLSWIPEQRRVDLNSQPLAAVHDADAVIVDPPWHLEHFRAWISSASRRVRTGGTIAVAIPQRLTKVSAQQENSVVHAMLSTLGVVEIVPDALRYLTPSFERGVLSGRGLAGLHDWRTADLAIVKVTNKRALPFIAASADSWTRLHQPEGVWAARGGIYNASATELRMLNGVGRKYLNAEGINLVHSSGLAGSLPDSVGLIGSLRASWRDGSTNGI